MQKELTQETIAAAKLKHAGSLTEKLYLIVYQEIDFNQIEEDRETLEYLTAKYNKMPFDISTNPYDIICNDVFDWDIEEAIKFFSDYKPHLDSNNYVLDWRIDTYDISAILDENIDDDSNNVTIYSETEGLYTTYIEIK